MYDGKLLKIASASACENFPLRWLPFSLYRSILGARLSFGGSEVMAQL
jgi:hypothetical protein